MMNIWTHRRVKGANKMPAPRRKKENAVSPQPQPKKARAPKSKRRTVGGQAMPENKLFIGNNLGYLRDHDKLPNNSVDLVYLDPPFNSKRDYNTFFRERSGER